MRSSPEPLASARLCEIVAALRQLLARGQAEEPEQAVLVASRRRNPYKSRSSAGVQASVVPSTCRSRRPRDGAHLQTAARNPLKRCCASGVQHEEELIEVGADADLRAGFVGDLGIDRLRSEATTRAAQYISSPAPSSGSSTSGHGVSIAATVPPTPRADSSAL